MKSDMVSAHYLIEAHNLIDETKDEKTDRHTHPRLRSTVEKCRINLGTYGAVECRMEFKMP